MPISRSQIDFFCIIGQRKYQLDLGDEIIMLVTYTLVLMTFSMLEINGSAAKLQQANMEFSISQNDCF